MVDREGECSKVGAKKGMRLGPGPPVSLWVCLPRKVLAESTTRKTQGKDGLIGSNV